VKEHLRPRSAPSRKKRRGTVSVEIMVMLPVFVSLFFAVTYLHGLGTATQAAGVAARACAWTYALQGCDGNVPSACQQIALGKPEGLRISLPGSELELMPNGETDFTGSWFDAIAELPVLGPAVKSVFGVGRRIKATRSTQEYMQEGQKIVSASNYVLCNTKAESWSAKIATLFDQLMNCDEKRDPLCKD
jgi:hypothetical protein